MLFVLCPCFQASPLKSLRVLTLLIRLADAAVTYYGINQDNIANAEENFSKTRAVLIINIWCFSMPFELCIYVYNAFELHKRHLLRFNYEIKDKNIMTITESLQTTNSCLIMKGWEKQLVCNGLQIVSILTFCLHKKETDMQDICEIC